MTKNFDAQSSMCDGQTLYDSDGRTLETWDVESVHRLYSWDPGAVGVRYGPWV